MGDCQLCTDDAYSGSELGASVASSVIPHQGQESPEGVSGETMSKATVKSSLYVVFYNS